MSLYQIFYPIHTKYHLFQSTYILFIQTIIYWAARKAQLFLKNNLTKVTQLEGK